MTNWWDELEPETVTEKRLKTEVEQLRAANAKLLAACYAAREYTKDRPGVLALRITEQLEEAITLTEGQTEQPAGPRLPGLE